jgi:acetyl-CoA carboxylase biotin carboxylase subunit
MRLKRALNEYVIEGVETNIPLLINIINEKDFLDGSFNISWVENIKSS